MAAVAAGADGLMIEVHNDPESALCDGAQSLKPKKYDELIKRFHRLQVLSARRSNADNLPLAVPYERMAVQTKPYRSIYYETYS